MIASQARLAALPVAKKLPGSVYIHKSRSDDLPDDIRENFQNLADAARLGVDDFDLVKVDLTTGRVSLLSYPTLLDDGFPVLAGSWTRSAEDGAVIHRDYRGYWNPPVLHRKELLLGTEHPRYAEFAALTAAAERAGLFDDPASIGHRMQWKETLRSRGLQVIGHSLVEYDPVSDVEEHHSVFRFRTALRRSGLSTPMQALARYGYLEGNHSIFDYGCGKGDDLASLEELGVVCNGWDPFFFPEGMRQEADVVNLGFVLNVIEDANERTEALRSAFGFARRLLVVAVLVGGRTAAERYRLFNDGVLTSRGTFQKYFTQEELQGYIEQVLGRQPIAIGAGLCFVFRSDEDEQTFLATRNRGVEFGIPSVRHYERRPDRAIRIDKWESNRVLIEDFYRVCLDFGRVPSVSEWDGVEALSGVGSPRSVYARLMREKGAAEMDVARHRKRDDLLVFLALNLFEQRKSYGHFPQRIQKDIKEFLGTFKSALALAKELLFSVGKAITLIEAARLCAQSGLGFIDPEDAFFCHPTVIPQLAAPLRVYVGCANQMFGDLDQADLIKIHTRSGKLTIQVYDNFDESFLPLLKERIKVDLRQRRITFIDHTNGDRQPLYFKSRYLPADFPNLAEQMAFEARIAALPGIDFSGYGPGYNDLLRLLKSTGDRSGIPQADDLLRKRSES